MQHRTNETTLYAFDQSSLVSKTLIEFLLRPLCYIIRSSSVDHLNQYYVHMCPIFNFTAYPNHEASCTDEY